MRLVICAVLILLARGARDFVVDTHAGTALGIGILLIVGYFVGEFLERLKLPRLTGYILTGLALGPYGLALITGEIGNLQLFNGTAIALIAMTAGAELDLKALRPLARSIVGMVSFAVLAGALAITATALACRALFGFLGDVPFVEAVVVCAVLGVVLAAQSPAVVVALRRETGACGVLSETVLGAVIVGDLLVILLFAIAQTGANVVLGAGGSAADTALHFLWHIAGSVGIGAVAGAALGAWLRHANGASPMLVLGACFVLAEVGLRLALDPIVVAVVVGALIRNRIPSAVHALEHGLGAIALPMYVLFFAVTGASLHLDVLAVLGIPAVLLVLARAAGMIGGARLGASLAGADPKVRRAGGLGLLPQAGLAIALAMVFARTFPGIGDQAAALALGVVALNELIAPAIWRTTLLRSGECDLARPGSPAPSAAAEAEAIEGAAEASGAPDTPAATASEAPRDAPRKR